MFSGMSIANGAHVAGLVTGLAMAFVGYAEIAKTNVEIPGDIS